MPRSSPRMAPDGPSSVARRLDELAERYSLAALQRGQLAALLDAIGSDPTAPTSVTDPAAAVDAHIADALVGLELSDLRGARLLADLGSGAGIPGLVLAIALPDATVSLVESQRRKCVFIESVALRLGLGWARVVCARAEEWQDGLERCDVVVARALAPQPVVLEYAAPLLRLGGIVIDWRGRRSEAAERAALAAAGELGLTREQIRPVEPFPGALHRYLHVFVKTAPTPPRFPRRAGVARKRPLGA